jgi:hypothetical protein
MLGHLVEEELEKFGVDPTKGLTTEECRERYDCFFLIHKIRLQKNGPNRVRARKHKVTHFFEEEFDKVIREPVEVVPLLVLSLFPLPSSLSPSCTLPSLLRPLIPPFVLSSPALTFPCPSLFSSLRFSQFETL